MRIPVLADQHFGGRGDSEILYKIQQAFYEDIFWPSIDREGNVTEILCLGDVTDRRKYISYTTLQFAKNMFFEPAHRRGIAVHWLLGNHDLPWKHSLDLSSALAFREYPNVQVYKRATEVSFSGVNTLLVPWLCEQNMDESLQMIQHFQGSVIAGHFEFNGFDVHRGMPQLGGLDASPFASFPLVMTGHYHHKSSKGGIHYLGAPYEMIWTDVNDPRGFHWWTPETHQLDFVENPHKLFYKFYYDDLDAPDNYVESFVAKLTAANLADKIVKIVVKRKTNPLWYEALVDAVTHMGIYSITVVDDATINPVTGIAEDTEPSTLDTLTMIRGYVNGQPWSNTAFQQDVLSLMTDVYHEAAEHARLLARS